MQTGEGEGEGGRVVAFMMKLHLQFIASDTC